MVIIVELACIILASSIALYLYLKQKRRYWKVRNVPYIETDSIWGHMENPITRKRGPLINVKDMYDKFRDQGHIHGGIFMLTRPVYIPIDPELLRNIFARDFQHFVGRGVDFDPVREPLTGHLFNLDGDEWRNMRIKLTPTFTSGKMKMMFSTLLECGIPMIGHINKLVNDKTSLDIKEILACYTTDVIGSCAFGLECNSFNSPDSEFRKYGREVFETRLSRRILQLPILRSLFKPRTMSMELETFFTNAIKNVLEYREGSNVIRKDFIELFLEMNKKAKKNGEKVLSLNQIAAQSFVFFIAGFETSSTTMTFCLHELAFNQDIQEKLREEITNTIKKHDGKLTYDGIMEMKYMDKIVNETLRKYPPLAVVPRKCTKDYKVPNTDVTLDKEQFILISVLGIQRDGKYYPNPNKFDPERFTDENKAKRPPFTFLPFGEGPRMCIGIRFGLMQTKAGLAMLLSNFRITPGKDETYDIVFDPTAGILTKKGKIMLNAERI